MSKMNILVHLNAYNDENATTTPTRNNFKWQREVQGISISEPTSQSLTLPSGQTATLFSGSVATSADTTTAWGIAPKAGSSQTYRISYVDNTPPAFRVSRASGGADASTVIAVTQNATLLTFSAASGTSLNLPGQDAVVGDEVRLGSVFSPLNQGKFKIIAMTTTSFTIQNPSGIPQNTVALGADFANQLSIFSADGVQVGDKLDIIAGFSSASFGTYEITDVSPNYVEIYSAQALPAETNISNNPSAFLIYRSAKSIVYIESDKKLEVKINGSATPNSIEPLQVGTTTMPGIFMSSSSMKSLQITNKSLETATIFYVTAE